ncbi:MAG: YncE family protein [Candidatus Marsarchaeota archaeon]|nr:YncE family protein [Candidatus Marsarchaeota archaeon]
MHDPQRTSCEGKAAKAQSATEYLSTYGWLIITVSIVLVVLFDLNVFQGKSILPAECLAQSGFLCTNPVLNTTGSLLITFGQSLGTSISITGLACASNSSEPGSFMAPTGSEAESIGPGAETRLTFLCPLASNTVGASFSGTLWIQYTKSGQTGQVIQIATVTARSTTSAATGSLVICRSDCTYMTTSGNNVIIFNMATNTVVNVISSGFSNPSSVAFSPDGSYAYVVNYNPNNVVVLDTATNTVVNVIRNGVGATQGLAVSHDSNYLYITSNNNVTIVDLSTGMITNANAVTSGLDEPGGIAFSTDGSYMYIANGNTYSSGSNNVVIVDTATNKAVNAITGFSGLGGGGGPHVALSPSGTYAYVTEPGAGTVEIVNTETNAIVGAITSGISAPSGVAFAPDGSYAYVANNGNIVIVDTATNTVVNAITAGLTSPLSVAFSPSGTYAYVTQYAPSNMVVIIDTATNTVSGSVPPFYFLSYPFEITMPPL